MGIYMHLDKKPKITIVGLPNVGKSTLFNKLIGSKKAIVMDRPGVTRDCQSVQAYLKGTNYKLEVSDTPGISSDSLLKKGPIDLEKITFKKTISFIEDSDLLIFVFDGLMPFNTEQKEFFNLIRKTGKEIIPVVNKAESKKRLQDEGEIYSLGFSPLFISAEHGVGISELIQEIEERLKKLNFVNDTIFDLDDEDDEQEKEDKSIIKLAIIGRPNAGKSTLTNTLLKREAQIVSDMPGVTRDTIEFDWEYSERKFKLYDTAGVRRRAKIKDQLEKISVSKTIETINFANVCVLVVDSTEIENTDYGELLNQDLTIASRVVEEGRGLVVALNKFDLIKDRTKVKNRVVETARSVLSQIPNVSIVTMSASKGKGIDDLLKSVISSHEKWNKRVSTSKLNNWLREITAKTPPPASSIHRSKLKYMTQVNSRPPSFVIFSTRISDIPESYKRFLTNQLRKAFELEGTPIRLQFRQQENPYAKKK